MKTETITGLFLQSAENNARRTAFNYFDQEWKSVSYEFLLDSVRGIAQHLLSEGLQPKERVALYGESRWEWCAAYLATLMAGGIAVPIDAQLGPKEVSAILHDSEAVLIFHSDKTAPDTGDDIRKINFDGPLFREIGKTTGAGRYPGQSREALASILYTSGTTGKPKGVMLTNRNFCAEAEAVINAGLVSHEDNVLAILPLHHTYAFMCTFLVPVFLGATITYPQGMKGPELMAAIKEKGVTILVAVPQLLELIRNGILRKFREKARPVSLVLTMLLRMSGKVRSVAGVAIGKSIFGAAHRAFGERFRFFASGGARLAPEVMEDLEALGFTVLEGYGLTETSPVVTFNPIGKRKPGSAGRPLPSVEIRIVNPSGTGEGEIAIRGPMVMEGYYRNPEATSQVIRDGWFMSGDLGYLDRDGYLFITGRAKEVIVLSSGKNVYPEEVEKEYKAIPLIKEICVTAIAEYGIAESLHGVIVPDLDYAKRERIGNIHETLKWELNRVSMTLPPPIRLKGFTLSQEPLPRTPLGKLRRFMIADLVKRTREEGRRPKERDEALMRDEVGKVVVGCLASLLKEATPVVSSDNLELDLGLDSLERVELVVALEKAFSVKLPETLTSEVQTVGELVSKVREVGLRGIAAAEGGSRWKELFTAEPPDEEKQKVGLGQGELSLRFATACLRILRLIFRIGFKLDVHGVEHIPQTPFIVAPNHCSNMDAFVVGAAVPPSVFRVLYFQGFQKYFQGALPSLFARLAHVIPIDTESYLSGAFQLSSYVLRNKRSLCIFPEGGRSVDGNLLEFKKGIGILAVEHNVPVVPVLIEGTFEALPRGAWWPRFSKVSVSFGEPLHPAVIDYSVKPEGVDDYGHFADEVRKRVEGLRRKKRKTEQP